MSGEHEYCEKCNGDMCHRIGGSDLCDYGVEQDILHAWRGICEMRYQRDKMYELLKKYINNNRDDFENNVQSLIKEIEGWK